MSEPIFLKGGSDAVLLLHSYTSDTKDVKELSAFLNQHGYTCYASLYKGHGKTPEDLLFTQPEDWWKSVEDDYHFLIDEGYENIFAAGLSLGGLLTMKVCQNLNVRGAVIMSSPKERHPDRLKNHVLRYARRYKIAEDKTDNEIAQEIERIAQVSDSGFIQFSRYIEEVMEGLSDISVPIRFFYGGQDEDLYKVSAEYFYEHVKSVDKAIKAYPDSRHIMLLDQEKDTIFKDILHFFNRLK